MTDLRGTMTGVTGSENDDRDGATRLAAAVAAQRKRIHRSQEGVAKAGGPSAKTLYAIESGTANDLRPSTLRRLDEGLRWPYGTAARVLAGTATAEEVAAVRAPRDDQPDLADRVGSAYTPPLGSALRALSGRPSADAAGRVAATLDALIAEDHERLRALLDEGREPGEPEVEEVLARLVKRAEQLNRVAGGSS